MTSWPWMKGIDVAIADPIEPVVPEDTRPAVKDLIQENRGRIDRVKAAIESDPLYDPSKHDDLWILRFILSHKKTKPSTVAAQGALLFRKTYDLDSKDIRAIPVQDCDWEAVVEYQKHRCQDKTSAFGTLPDEKRGVVSYIKMSKMTPGAHKFVSEEAWKKTFIYMSEWTFQHLDHVTRTTGRLTRSIRFIDLDGVTMASHRADREGTKLDRSIGHAMADVYPQLSATLFLCRPPEWVHVVWAVMRKILPKRVVSKVDFVTPHKNENERARILQHISMENLPSLYGGKESKLLQSWESLDD